MSIALVPTQENNRQAGMSKNMVPGLEWFNGNRTKFKDWWRGIRLFLKSNKVMETNDRITAILAYLREGIADIYTQKKLNELDCQDRWQWTLFYYLFSLYFIFLSFFFYFSIFRTTRVRGYQSRCHISHKLMA